MREPQRDKTSAPTRFPHRVGNKKILDRDMTPEERQGRQEEKAALNKARQFRRRKARERAAE